MDRPTSSRGATEKIEREGVGVVGVVIEVAVVIFLLYKVKAPRCRMMFVKNPSSDGLHLARLPTPVDRASQTSPRS